VDFRVEGDTEVNLLMVDASTDRVGIGTATPGTVLDVVGVTSTDGLLSEGASTFNDAGADVDFRVEGDTLPNLLFVDAGLDVVYISDGATGGTIPTAPTGDFTAGTLLRLQNNSADSDNAILALVAGAATGLSEIDFGDAGDANIGAISYVHSSNQMQFTAGANMVLSLGAGFMTVNDDGDDVDVQIESDNLVGCFFVDGGNDGVSIGGEAAGVVPAARLHVVQDSLTGAVPCLELDQDDLDMPFIEFDGASAGDLTTNITTLTTENISGHVRVTINGATRWIPFSTTPS
jgi:hypothetical protein